MSRQDDSGYAGPQGPHRVRKRAKFNDRFLRSLAAEPGKKDRLVFDAECPGLGVRVTAKGSKSFLVQWTDPATRRKVREPLGVWGSITIDQARAGARSRLGDVAKGLDPSAERRRKRAEADAERVELALTLSALIEQWGELHLTARRPRYASEAKRALRYAFIDYLRKPAARLKRSDVIEVLDRVSTAGKGASAARTMAYGRACFAWAGKRGRVGSNPFSNLPLIASAASRERVLSEKELAEVWAAASALPYPFGPFYRLSILTLQRREEVAGMRWSELAEDLSRWTIPGERMKNGRPHYVHLAPVARDILAELPRRVGSDLVFTTTGATPISGYSRAKAMLDAAVMRARAVNAGERGGEPGVLVPWRLHDVRRTGVSKLAAMGFDTVVLDKLLAHQPVKLRGVASVYQRHDFAAERARALEVWADHVCGAGPGGDLVQLKSVR